MNNASMLSLTLLALALFAGEFAPDRANDIIVQCGEDWNADGSIDGRDVQGLVDRVLMPRVGIYTARELATTLLHPDAERLRIERERWLAARPNVAADPALARVIQAALYAAEHDFIGGMARGSDGQLDLPDRRANLLRIARDWPGGLSVHDQTMWQIPDLCRLASLSPEARSILRPVLTRCLDELRTGKLWGTNIGVGLRCRVWLCRVLGIETDPMEDWGDAPTAAHRWGLKSILAHVTDDGLFNWDGTDLWYWWFTSRPALVAAGWHERHRLPPDLRRRFDAMYLLPIRMLCVDGGHPLIGSAKASPKPYRFFGGWIRDWPGTDDASAWARRKIRVERSEPMRFDDLIYGGGDSGADLTVRPSIGTGTRVFGDRLIIIEVGTGLTVDATLMTSTVIHFGDGQPINGGHRTPLPPGQTWPVIQEVRK